MVSSAVESCGRKWLRMEAGSEKRTPWWNQDVIEVIRAKKDAFKALLQNRSSSDLQFRFFKAQKSAAQAVRMSKERFWEKFVVGWIPTIHRQIKYFGRSFATCVEKV